MTEAQTEERRRVVYWRHFERFEEDLTLEEFEAVKDLWGRGDCAIESVNGADPFTDGMKWIWGRA